MSIRKKKIQAEFFKRIDQLPGAVFEYQQWPDGRCRFPYASQAIEKILFISPKALAKDGLIAWEYLCEDYREPMVRALEESRKSGKDFEISFCTQPPQHDVTWVQIHAIAEPQEDGSTVWRGYMVDVTRRQRTGIQAEQRTALLDAIFNNLEDQFYYMDIDCRILGANTAYCQYHGVSSEKEVIGRTDVDLYPNELGVKLYEEEQALIDSGETRRIKERHVLSTGKVSYLESIKCPLTNSAGNVIGLAGISRDITDQVRNEKALLAEKKRAEASSNLLQTIFNNMDAQLYYKDRSSKVLGGNPAWAKARGVRCVDDLIGKTDIDIHPVPLGKHLFDEEQELMARKQTFRERERHELADGSVCYIDSVKCPIINEQGEVTGLVGISNDVTQEEKDREVLLEAKQHSEHTANLLHTIFSNLKDQFYYKDRNGRMMGANPNCYHYHGFNSEEEIIGKTDLEIYKNSELGKQLFVKEQKIMETKETLREREFHTADDGSPLVLESIKCPIINDEGEVTGLVGISRDVTQLVEDQSAGLSAEKKAADTSAQHSFLSDLSQEMQAPISGVIDAAKHLASTGLNPQQKEILRCIQTSGEKMQKMMDRLSS